VVVKKIIAIFLLICAVNAIFMVPARAKSHHSNLPNYLAKDKLDISSCVFEILIEEIFNTNINIPDSIEMEISDFESTRKGKKDNVTISIYWAKSLINLNSHCAFIHSLSIKIKCLKGAVLAIERGYGFIFRLTPF
jgi:uncharacterized membrane protein